MGNCGATTINGLFVYFCVWSSLLLSNILADKWGIPYMQLWVRSEFTIQRHISFTSNVIIDIIYHLTAMFNFINTIQWIFNRIESQRALLCLYRTHCQIVVFVLQTQLIPSLLMLNGGAFLLSLGFTYPIFNSSCIVNLLWLLVRITIYKYHALMLLMLIKSNVRIDIKKKIYTYGWSVGWLVDWMVCLYFAFCTLHNQNKHFIYKYLLPRTFYSLFSFSLLLFCLCISMMFAFVFIYLIFGNWI